MDGSQLIGSIIPFGGNFAPRYTGFCYGAEISIAQYTALYAVIGTNFGGDGRVNFKLPDLRGRVPVGTGTGPGLINVNIGLKYGSQSMTLDQSHLPTHNHTALFSPTGGGGADPLNVDSNLNAVNSDADSNDPTGRVLAKAAQNIYSSPTGFGKTPVNMANESINNTVTGGESGIDGGIVTVYETGGSQPFSIQSPILGISYCMALEGTFPARN